MRSLVILALTGVVVTSATRVSTAPQNAANSQTAPQPTSPRRAGPPGPAGSAAAETSLAALKRYCATCHSDRVKTGGVSFEGLTAESIPQHSEVLEKAVRKMRGRVMPPPGAKQPDAATLDSLVGWLEASLDRAAATPHVPDQGLLHRLNRKEYSNAVRDLLAIVFDAREVLPPDDLADGYDNIAAALQVSPSFIEQYTLAAYLVAVKAMGRPDARPSGWTFRAGAGTQLTHVPGLPLGTRGGILANVDLPADGEYVVNIADVVSHIWGNGMEFENPLVVTLDSKIVYETVIGGDEDAKAYDQGVSGAFDKVNARLKNIRFFASGGPHRIGVAFRRQTFAESDDQQQMFAPGGGQDRLYRLSSFELRGPFNAKGLGSTPSRDRIFVCRPPAGATADVQARCARQIVTSLARRAYRRAVTADDVNELMRHYEDGAKESFEVGIRRAVTGVLSSPFFLYRAEARPVTVRAGQTYAISDTELASSLSFFLWNSIPDDELLQLGIEGRLSQPAVLEKQVRRMLADPRATTLASNFVHQWLDMRRLDEIVPDTSVFPYASGRSDPRSDFKTELTLFADSIFREDRSVVDLLRASHTYVNERVALHYGITDVKGDRFRRVELKDSVRWGLLGKGAILMAAAYPNRTSPVLRGAFILKHLQGVPPANPPMNVPALDEKDIGTTKALTVREMMAKHRSNPTCSSCHAVMDPLGLALENFDGTGMWRDRDRYAGVAIDATGELPDGTPISGPDDLRQALLKRPEQFVQTFAEGLLTYATGRKIEAADMPTVRRIVRNSAAGGYRFTALVLGVVRSEPFRMRQVPETPPPGTRVAQNSRGVLGPAVRKAG